MACGEIGLDIKYFYSLTQRQFYNIVAGYRKKEDYLSRERWQISRKIMFAYMCKYLGENGKETDILVFPWEAKTMSELTAADEQTMMKKQAECEAFFEKYDNKENDNDLVN